MKLGCVLLAAGAGKRFGGNKLLCRVEGEPMIARALRLYGSIPFETRVCVTRAEADEIARLSREAGFAVAVNPDPARGVGTSVSIATAELLRLEPETDGILYAVADQPYLTRESVLKLTEAFAREPDDIASLAYQTRRGNPAIFPRTYFAELTALSEDTGGGAVIRRHPDRLRLTQAGAERELCDVDTRESL